MAKKQSYMPPMGGDANLIQGAGFAAKNLMQPVGQGIIEQGNLRAQENKQRKQEISKQADARMAAFMENMPQNIDIAKVPEQMRPEITNFLMDEKDNYFRNAQIAATAGPRSPQYAEAIQNMNTIMQKFQNLNNDLTKLYDTKKKTLEDFELGSISNGTSADAKDFMTRLTTDEITLGINSESGRLALGDDGSMNMDNLPKMHYKDHESAQAILTLNNQLYNNGRPMDAGQESIVRMQLQNIMDKGGNAAVRSLATDDHIIPGGLGIDPEDYTPEELKKLVLDQYVNVMKTASQNGYKAVIQEENRADNRALERSINLAKRKKELGVDGNGGDDGMTNAQRQKIKQAERIVSQVQGDLQDIINMEPNEDVVLLVGSKYKGKEVLGAKKRQILENGKSKEVLEIEFLVKTSTRNSGTRYETVEQITDAVNIDLSDPRQQQMLRDQIIRYRFGSDDASDKALLISGDLSDVEEQLPTMEELLIGRQYK
jgi:hypothetical protein